MNKKLKIVSITFGIVYLLYFIISQIGIFKMYKSPTNSNEPNLKMNTIFFASNLINPKIGDFVCYKREDNFSGKHTRVHKLCGMENDIIEIKNGVVYLNDLNIDKEFEHIHFYQISKQEYENITIKEKISNQNIALMIDQKNVKTTLEDLIAKKYDLTSKRVIDEKGKFDKTINTIFKYNWNKDNFGPLKIPKGKIFVIGDNRDNSEDSRYIGLINKSDIVGVVIGK